MYLNEYLCTECKKIYTLESNSNASTNEPLKCGCNALKIPLKSVRTRKNKKAEANK